MEPASLVMERKMLLGIKRRAEQLAAASRQAPEQYGQHSSDSDVTRAGW